GCDVIDDLGDAGTRVRARHVGENRLVAAGDVVADASGGNCIFVGNNASDGNRVALVVVGHEGRGAHGRMCLGAADLIQRTGFNGVAENCDVVDQLHG